MNTLISVKGRIRHPSSLTRTEVAVDQYGGGHYLDFAEIQPLPKHEHLHIIMGDCIMWMKYKVCHLIHTSQIHKDTTN